MKDRLQSAKCAERLKALADPDRLKIIQYLQGGPKTVSALAELVDAPPRQRFAPPPRPAPCRIGPGPEAGPVRRLLP
jgi:hypothetical protein